MKKHFTATVYILENKKVLLIHHKKLQKWLPPGGHMDENETPPEAAIREAFEETGLKIEIVPQENIWVNHWNANSFERPYMCLLEEIPAYRDNPQHQHIDLIYVGKPVDGQIIHNTKECHAIKWFNLEQVKKLVPDQEIFKETLNVIEHLLTK